MLCLFLTTGTKSTPSACCVGVLKYSLETRQAADPQLLDQKTAASAPESLEQGRSHMQSAGPSSNSVSLGRSLVAKRPGVILKRSRLAPNCPSRIVNRWHWRQVVNFAEECIKATMFRCEFMHCCYCSSIRGTSTVRATGADPREARQVLRARCCVTDVQNRAPPTSGC